MFDIKKSQVAKNKCAMKHPQNIIKFEIIILNPAFTCKVH